MIYPTYKMESTLELQSGFKYVVGVDEAGRGAGSGPVVAAAAHIPGEVVPKLLNKVNDSKKMSPKRREEMYDLIRNNCDVGVQAIDAGIIDEVNVLEATKLAMKSAVEQLEYFDYILIDGTVDLKCIVCPQQQVIKGDSLSLSIAAASVVAKVYRDRIMQELHAIYPIYGWGKNKGYLTKEHIEAIKTYGVTDYHRTSFKRVGR